MKWVLYPSESGKVKKKVGKEQQQRKKGTLYRVPRFDSITRIKD